MFAGAGVDGGARGGPLPPAVRRPRRAPPHHGPPHAVPPRRPLHPLRPPRRTPQVLLPVAAGNI